MENLFSIFKPYHELLAILSEKKDGSMSPEKKQIKNRKKFLASLEIDEKFLVSAHLSHKNKVAIVGKKEAGTNILNVDGLITNEKGLFLSITVGDCLPIYFYDPKKKIIALLHGGWRSLSREIIKMAIEKMKNHFLSDPKDILAAIGPGISVCHYEVGKEMKEKFRDLPEVKIFKTKKDKLFLDLKQVAKLQLIKAGLKRENIEISKECTWCQREKYFSSRRDRPLSPQLMMAIIGIKKYKKVKKLF